MAATDISIIHHIAVLLLLLYALNSFNCGHPVLYLLSLIYLYLVHQRYLVRLTRKLQFQERRTANQRRVLSDSETVRWLNHALQRIWPLCMEEIVSQKIFLPIIPWFLDKYKPWTVKSTAIQHLYLGRNPPLFTSVRVLQESSDDDHLVLELGINFLTADDMTALLAAKLRKRVGFGIVTKMHLTSMHVEGRVLVGVKFINKWPYIGRLRICFAEPPYFQMTIKPMFNHGVDVTELPGVAGWLDNLLAMAFEQTLVEPNMMVVDMEKFVSPQKENWFSVLVKEPIAYALVEVIAASDVKPSDRNGLSDPYVKGQLGPYRFKTKIQKSTLDPKWQEEFKIPLCCWESDSVMTIELRDKDPVVDDRLGVCSVDLNDYRDGKRHDMWLSLEDIKVGRLHLAITVVEANSKVKDRKGKDKKLRPEDSVDRSQSKKTEKGSSTGKSKKSQKVADTLEAVDIEGQEETGIWVLHPGSDVPHLWEPRKGRGGHRSDNEIIRREGDGVASTSKSSSQDEDSSSSSSSDDNVEGSQMSGKRNRIKEGLRKLNTALHRNHKKEDISVSVKDPIPSPAASVKAVDAYKIGVKLRVEDSFSGHNDPKSAKPDGSAGGSGSAGGVSGSGSAGAISGGGSVGGISGGGSVGGSVSGGGSVGGSVSGGGSVGESVSGGGSVSGSGYVTFVEDTSPDSSTKVHMKEKAKSIFKQAGKSARQLKSALSRKGTGTKDSKSPFRKPIEEESEDKINEDEDSDSTDEESPSTYFCQPLAENVPISTNPLNCREQVPVAARGPLASVSYVAPPTSDDSTSLEDDNADLVAKNPTSSQS